MTTAYARWLNGNLSLSLASRRRLVPMKKPRRATLVLWIVVVAIALVTTSLWLNEGPLWRWVILKRVDEEYSDPVTGHVLRGWQIRLRFRDLSYWREAKMWYVKNGYLAQDWHKGFESRVTSWNLDGTVRNQVIHRPDDPTTLKKTPPWLWGVTAQTEPTAPWWDHEKNAPRVTRGHSTIPIVQ